MSDLDLTNAIEAAEVELAEVANEYASTDANVAVHAAVGPLIETLARLALDPEKGVPFNDEFDVAIVSAWIQGVLDE